MNRHHHLSAVAAVAALLTAALTPTTALASEPAPHHHAAEDTLAAPQPPDEATPLEEEEEDDSIADFRVDGGAGFVASTWRGDFGGVTNLRIGVRFIDIIAPYAQLTVGYATVDQRMLTTVAIGAQIWAPENWPLRLYGRVAALHQHEEAVSVIAGDFGKALFGVGDGIRHRPGLELAAGVDVPFWDNGDDLEFYGLVDGGAKIFPDSLGPVAYPGAGMNVGLNYEL
ncbi:MAG TPA: hypothetical protein ENK57_17640 [Polyangiaceae bacterium]|nr:hypothetical protein [Polyangiaceae bacterium]